MIKNKFRLVSKECKEKIGTPRDVLFSRCLCPHAPKRKTKLGYCREKWCPKMTIEHHPFVKWAKDHYWDSLEKDRDLIIKHIEDCFKEVNHAD